MSTLTPTIQPPSSTKASVQVEAKVPDSNRLAKALLKPLAIYCASRIFVTVSIIVGSQLIPTVGFPDVIAVWDGAWFSDVAINGYQQHPPVGQSSIAFFPLFPLLVRLLMNVTPLDFAAAAYLLNFVAAGAFTVFFWLLARKLLDEKQADRATALMCFFPGALVFSLAYSEAITFALSAACLFALLDKRWITAGVLSALATTGRFNALALFLPCAWAAYVAIRERRDWRALAAPLLAPIGAIGFLVYLWRHTGEMFVFFRVQKEGWSQTLTAGFHGNWHNIRSMIDAPFADRNIISRNTFLVLLCIGLYLLWKWRPPMEIVLYVLSATFFTVTYIAGPLPRLVLSAFPLIMATSRVLKEAALSVVIGCFAMVTSLMAIVTVTTLWLTP